MAGSKSIGSLFVTVSAKPKKFNTALTDSEKRMKKFKSVATTTFKVVAAASVAMGVAVTVGIGKAIAAASDLEETTSKFNTVFEGQQAVAEAWADTLVDSYAMSTREAKFFLSSIQDLLVPMGVNAKLAGELSNEVVKLSADLGSFNNLPTESVILDIQSALVGNFETMKKYGVVLNMTVVQQKALEMGLADTKAALTAGMKAQAAYALMVEGSAAAIGDMERTSGGYANQVKKLKSQIEDISAIIGTRFLPAATEVVKIMNEMAAASKDSLGDNFTKAMKVALAGMHAFEVSWQTAQMVGQVALITIADALTATYEVLKNTLLKPLDLVSDLLVKLGTIDANPFDAMTEGLLIFKNSSRQVAADILGDIEKTNARYEGWSNKLDTVEEKTKSVGTASQLAAEDTSKAWELSFAQIQKLQEKHVDFVMSNSSMQFEWEALLLEQKRANLLAAGFEEQLVNESLAESYRTLNQEKLLASDEFMAGVFVGLEQLAENAKTVAEIGAETTTMLFNGVTKGIGKSVANAIVSGQSLAKSMKAVMKTVAANIIANLVTIGVQRAVLSALNIGSTMSEHAARSAASAGDTWSGAFAATSVIPVVGPILAPGVAAASLATMLGGLKAAETAGAAAGGALHGGLDSVPREQSFLLDKGERVISRSQNEDLTAFLANGGRSANVTFNITAFDSDTMTDTVRTTIIPMLQDALELNSEDFRDSIQRAVA